MTFAKSLAMRVAIPVADCRVSPVFDSARRLLLVEIGDGAVLTRQEIALDEMELAPRARRVAELGANTLICGAISQPLEWLLAASGIDVIPRTCGRAEEVLSAFLAGTLDQTRFAMPGCKRRRRFRGGR